MMDLKIKIKLKIFLFVFISCVLFTGVLPGYVSAQETEVSGTIQYIELKINENGVVDVAQHIELHALEKIYRADALIPKARNIAVYDSTLDSKLEYGSVVIDGEELINFYFPEPLNAGEKRNITINYSTEFFTNKQGDTWELSFLLNLSNKSVVKAVFPENVVISFTSSEIVPSTYIEDEKQVLELESAGSEIDFLCEYRFMEKQEPAGLNETGTGGTGINQTKNETQEDGEGGEDREYATDRRKLPNMPLFVVILIIILIIISAAALYYFYYFKPGKEKTGDKEPKKRKKINYSIARLLDENERTVVELLQSTDKEITQAHIRKSTKIPGSTLSKVMLRLEERNIIERRGEGKTKRVKLKEWIFE